MRLAGKDFRRALRRSSTAAERRLWSVLRGRRLDGLKFRRQHPVGPYVLDFYCRGAGLAVELDGSIHDGPGRAVYDDARTVSLNAKGIRVVRFSNEQVRDQLDIVAAAIQAEAARPPHPVPLPVGEGTP
ncbi:endonuclease domain-containing protein [Rubrivirga sp. IMCC45206]|uniref:endonuclease domain-containing protein n=1 Tax=Rubrivirga sp. IMCC45206 TaxID=3391614 RepID=UPI00398FCE07